MANEDKLQAGAEKILDKYVKKGQLRYIRFHKAIYRWFANPKNKLIPNWLKYTVLRQIKDVPDLTILFRNGKYICVELKVDSNTLTPGQEKWAEDINENNFHEIRTLKKFRELLLTKLKESEQADE